MENLYLIRKMQTSVTHFFGETTSETPNVFTTQEFSSEKLHEIAETQLSQAKDMLKKFYSNIKFSKVIVTLTYSPVNSPDLEHCILMGFDEEGEVYCS